MGFKLDQRKASGKSNSNLPQKSVITLRHDRYFSLAKRTGLHFAKCWAKHSNNNYYRIVLWTEVVTMWQDPAWLSSLRRISNWTYRCPKNIGVTPAAILMAKRKYKSFMAKWGWDLKTNLQSQNTTKAARRAIIENLEEELTQYDNLAFLVILFFNSGSMASSFGESSRVARSPSPRMGKSN